MESHDGWKLVAAAYDRRLAEQERDIAIVLGDQVMGKGVDTPVQVG